MARYWIVDIDAQSLEIYTLRDGGYVLAGTYCGDDTVECDVPAEITLRLGEIWGR